MIYDDEDGRYKQVVESLKQLPKVNAPLRFEADLMRRINAGKYEIPRKQSIWDTILTPAKLVPSTALALIAIILLFVINTSNLDQNDPLSLEPRIREDLIQASSQGISLDEQVQSASKPNLRKENRQESNFTTVSSITKSGLNFRQINLTEDEKRVIISLREKIKQYFDKQKPAGK